MHPYFNVFGFALPAYWLLTLLGAVAAFIYIYVANRSAESPLAGDDMLHMAVLGGVGAMVGGKVLYVIATLPLVIENWALLSANPRWLVYTLFGGLVFYGGLFGALVAVYLYCRHYNLSFKEVMAIATPATPLFHLFGRVGCFLSGCCWGIEVPWGVAFNASLAAPNGVPLLPVQLIEAGFNLLLFIFLAVAVKRLKRRWMVLPLYLMLYAAARFVLEFFRGDLARGVFLLSTSQWISLAILVVVPLLFLHGGANREKM